MRFLPDRESVTAAVIGLGYVGSCLAAALADRGMPVVGVDTDRTLVEEMNRGHCRFKEPELPELIARLAGTPALRVTTSYEEAVEAADVVVIAVGTPVQEDGALLDTQLRGVCEALSACLRPGRLVIFKSTVPPGTTRELLVPLLERGGLRAGVDFGVAFCPERLSEGVALSELRRFPVVIGGWDANSTAAAAVFWEDGLGVEVVPCTSPEVAEMVKLANNWWVDHNIAMANELALVCGAVDVDVLEVIAAANSIDKGNGNINILTPSVGVGGSCLTKDPWMIVHSARERGVELRTVPAARKVNDSMPRHTASLIVEELAKHGKSPAGAKVAVLGLAFKNDTGDLRATPVEPVVAALREAGARVSLHDPLADADDAQKTFGATPAASVAEAVRDADCLALLAWHRPFKELDLTALKPLVADRCAVVDGRAYLSREQIDGLERAGFSYRGIGR
ncbi:UDP-N-acetyl-D-mannosaminuronic acid dehydrogenase [Sinosporangium album]|uniref:UDP-N-acetyl-D-mannosaminuronic acid dehydrogenase n=1 Tax=Sinosporangium album TaxID=504805 RepID=A0A1G8GHE0_9ACTN|nr:nucleotide sugar dehydrogenase [Sinosporangium album]SDH93808.1 UDP-N-acetyl-D-mannosaminuronic acid dehydrogenase [Sinosporangium album]